MELSKSDQIAIAIALSDRAQFYRTHLDPAARRFAEGYTELHNRWVNTFFYGEEARNGEEIPWVIDEDEVFGDNAE